MYKHRFFVSQGFNFIEQQALYSLIDSVFIKRVNVTILGHKINLRDLNLWGQHWIVGGSSVSLLCPLVPGLRESLAGGGESLKWRSPCH